jgi:adenylate cyclase
MEIERKFLLAEAPRDAGGASARLRQGYLAAGPGGEARVRDADGALTLTVKSGSGMERHEAEVPLMPEQFAALWPATEGRRIQKRRTLVPLDGLIAEVDEYEGGLAGLLVVEVEFASLEEARAFTPPEWFGREVTDDAAYKNASLALEGRPAD